MRNLFLPGGLGGAHWRNIGGALECLAKVIDAVGWFSLVSLGNEAPRSRPILTDMMFHCFRWLLELVVVGLKGHADQGVSRRSIQDERFGRQLEVDAFVLLSI